MLHTRNNTRFGLMSESIIRGTSNLLLLDWHYQLNRERPAVLHGIKWLYQAYVCVVVCLPCVVVKIK